MKSYSQLTEFDKQKIYDIIIDFIKDNTILDEIYYSTDDAIECIKTLVKIVNEVK